MSMVHLQYIKGVRQVLRDDSYPEDDITASLNRILYTIAGLGRFRFQEQTYTLNLTANNATYPVPSNMMAEKLFIYAPGNNIYEKEIPRRREAWTGTPVVPVDSGNTPTEWYRFGNNWVIVPVPNATMANHNIAVYHFQDVTPFLSPLDTTILPDRHSNVLIYGAAAELRPGLIIASPEGEVTIETAYQMAVSNMVRQELWDFASIPALRAGQRWASCYNWGSVQRIRG